MAYPNNAQNQYAVQYPTQNYNLLNLPREQMQAVWQDYGEPAAEWLKNQAIQQSFRGFAPIIPAGVPAIRYAMTGPQIQGRIAAIGATNLGAPIVAGIKTFANKPPIQKADKALSKIIDWIF